MRMHMRIRRWAGNKRLRYRCYHTNEWWDDTTSGPKNGLRRRKRPSAGEEKMREKERDR